MVPWLQTVMVMRSRTPAVGAGCLAAAIVACTTGGSGGDGGGGGSGGSGLNTGVNIPWSTMPASIPGNVTEDLTVHSASFTVQALEVLGDAGGGSSTQTSLLLSWGSDGSTPMTTMLPDAPAGVYSKLSMKVDGSQLGDSYTMAGTVSVVGIDTPYIVHDSAALAIDVPVTGALAPGQTLSLPIAVNLGMIASSIDFSKTDFQNGTFVLGSDSSQIDAFRAVVKAAFVANGSGTTSAE
jgi:hypothetical protein